MRILYAIQGTGNGHLARAEDIVPALRKHGEVDIFVSGAQADISIPFDVKYRSKGLSFYFGKKGGVDIINTIRRNKSRDAIKEVREFPIGEYDLLVNDFEPISAWAARLRGVRSVSLSHQASLLCRESPRPDHYDPIGSWILKNYAPADACVGFHFESFANNIFTPVIRGSVRNLKPSNEGHYTVYLPAYDDKKVLTLLSRFSNIEWQVFSKHSLIKYRIGRISVSPINNEAFIKSIAGSAGVFCGAGFETPAEALFLGKKLLVVPMKKQYEQHCNAAALKRMGIPVVESLKKKHLPELEAWIYDCTTHSVDYPDVADAAVERALSLVSKM